MRQAYLGQHFLLERLDYAPNGTDSLKNGGNQQGNSVLSLRFNAKQHEFPVHLPKASNLLLRVSLHGAQILMDFGRERNQRSIVDMGYWWDHEVEHELDRCCLA
jgi:hypothetical protein